MSIKSRKPFIDNVRFLAIFLMVIFHFTYDLNIFGIKIISQHVTLFWKWLPRLIVFLFMLAVGMSIGSKKGNVFTRSFHKSQIKVFFGAFTVSIVTYYLYPSRWVYFGTLHCIFLSRYLVSFLKPFPKTCLLLFVGINIPLFLGSPTHGLNLPIKAWIIFLFYLGLVMLFLEYLLRNQKFWVLVKKWSTNKIVLFSSKNSFWIYLIHQPLLFGLAYLIHQISL